MLLNNQIFYQGSMIDCVSELASSAERPLVILPGLFGSIINWRTVAKKLSQRQPVVVVDMRNHGQSPRAGSQSYFDMANDISSFCKYHQLTSIDLLGHSMGGKTAMVFAHQNAQIIEHLLILDIAPIAYKHSHTSTIKALLKLDLSELGSRAEAEKLLKPLITDTATRLFLLQSLVGAKGQYSWRLNLPVLLKYMPEIIGFPDLDSDCLLKTLFISGSESDYITEENRAAAIQLFPNANFSIIEGAGHWLHAEKPVEVIERIESFIKL